MQNKRAPPSLSEANCRRADLKNYMSDTAASRCDKNVVVFFL